MERRNIPQNAKDAKRAEIELLCALPELRV